MEGKPPDAFLSYTRFDDQHHDGAISKFRERLADAVRVVSGERFEIFQDIEGIGLGEHWSDKVDEMLAEVFFFIPILTPSYFKSQACRDELKKFISMEQTTGRKDLIWPIYYIRCPVLEDERLRGTDQLAQLIHERQMWDWRDLRLNTFRSKKVRQGLEALAASIDVARRREVPQVRLVEALTAVEPRHEALVRGIRNAIDKDQLFLELQPKIDLAHSQISGVEALLRWQHPDLGTMAPESFIHGVEQSELIKPITLWVLNTAMAALRAWQEDGYDFGVAINLSAELLHDSQFPEIVRQLLEAWDQQPGLLTLEITESALMADPAAALQVLTRISDIGCRLSLDDFGTGYSSLAYLRKMPINELKIDRSFVAAMMRDNNATVIVGSIVKLAKGLGLSVVAEGVENEEVLALLRSLGCEELQGNFLRSALTLDKLREWLRVSPWGRRPAVGFRKSVGTIFRDVDAPWCPEMVVIPSGQFTMGSPLGEEGRQQNEGPRHLVKIAYPLAVGRYPVTFDEYDHFAQTTGHRKPDDASWGRGRRPVIDVSWADAKAYVEWLASETGQPYRLPSEAEWEYACRAGTTKAFWTGATISADQANYDGSFPSALGRKSAARRQRTPIDTFEPNPWSLHDMHGNVLEWCEDCLSDSYVGAPTDGSAWLKGDCAFRVLRGGSWLSGPWALRSACRDGNYPEVRGKFIGFRVVRTLSHTERITWPGARTDDPRLARGMSPVVQ